MGASDKLDSKQDSTVKLQQFSKKLIATILGNLVVLVAFFSPVLKLLMLLDNYCQRLEKLREAISQKCPVHLETRCDFAEGETEKMTNTGFSSTIGYFLNYHLFGPQ